MPRSRPSLQMLESTFCSAVTEKSRRVSPSQLCRMGGTGRGQG
jgi:hypothetical protein